MRIGTFLLDILFPKHCLGCGKEGSYICKKCELFVIDLPGGGSEYIGIVKKAVHQAKYNGEYEILKELTRAIYELPLKNAIITYVPMHIKNEKQRGFNQAEIIAKELGRKYNLPVVKLLEKIKQTKDQTELTREQRIKNIDGCFKYAGAGPYACPPVPPILLVDDVYTTGATMAECAKALNKAGFKNISYFTIAKTI